MRTTQMTSSLTKLIKQMVLFFYVLMFIGHLANAQSYQGTIDHDGIYSFDYTIDCGPGGTTALVTVEYTTAEPTGLVPQLHLGGGVFVNMNGPSPFTYTITGLVGCEFSFQFYMAWIAGGLYQSPVPLTPDNISLPVELFAFNVEEGVDNSVNLSWSTATERNSDYFKIERTINGQQWNFIDNVQAAGNSASVLNYSYVDFSPEYSPTGLTYYRLKMVDIDGEFEYSPVRALKRPKGDGVEFSVSPNPTLGQVRVDFFNIDWSLGEVTMKVYNPLGKQVFSEIYSETKKEFVSIQDFSKTIYHFQFIQDGKMIYSTRVLKE